MLFFKHVLILAVIAAVPSSAFSSENDPSLGPIEQAESMGGEQYITDGGNVVQTEDLGEGEYMTDDGSILQEGPDGELMTEDENSIQVDE